LSVYNDLKKRKRRTNKKNDRQYNDLKKKKRRTNKTNDRQYNDLKRRGTNKTNDNPGPKEEEHKQDKRQTIQVIVLSVDCLVCPLL
jgi:hypothetical protein